MAMSNERVCLSALRGISAQAADILDHYAGEQAIWVPAKAFKAFTHALHWGCFVDLDLSLLDGLEPSDRDMLIDELRAYNERLHRQRQRVDRFHQAYRRWLDERSRKLPPEYQERLRSWRRCYGTYDYLRITGLGTNTGFQRFVSDPEECMRAFERAFANLEEQRRHERLWQAEAEAAWWSQQQETYVDGQGTRQLEEALRVLGLSPGATLVEIRRAYRTCARATHPDRQGAASTRQMAALNRAYNYLCRMYRPAGAETRRPES
jgi:DnaJ-domain-containing protein 1